MPPFFYTISELNTLERNESSHEEIINSAMTCAFGGIVYLHFNGKWVKNSIKVANID